MYRTLLSITNYKGDHFWCKKCLSLNLSYFSNIKVCQFFYSWRSWMRDSGSIFSLEQFKYWNLSFFSICYILFKIVFFLVPDRFDDGIWNLLIMVLFKVLEGLGVFFFHSAKYDNFYCDNKRYVFNIVTESLFLHSIFYF